MKTTIVAILMLLYPMIQYLQASGLTGAQEIPCLFYPEAELDTEYYVQANLSQAVLDCIDCRCIDWKIRCTYKSEECKANPPTIENQKLANQADQKSVTPTTTTTTTTTTTRPPTTRSPTTTSQKPKIIQKITLNPHKVWNTTTATPEDDSDLGPLITESPFESDEYEENEDNQQQDQSDASNEHSDQAQEQADLANELPVYYDDKNPVIVELTPEEKKSLRSPMPSRPPTSLPAKTTAETNKKPKPASSTTTTSYTSRQPHRIPFNTFHRSNTELDDHRHGKAFASTEDVSHNLVDFLNTNSLISFGLCVCLAVAIWAVAVIIKTIIHCTAQLMWGRHPGKQPPPPPPRVNPMRTFLDIDFNA